LKSKLQSGTSDKVEWFKNHSLTEEDRKKLIEEKLNRAMKFAVASKATKKK
jgi:hypothetical protein